MYSWPCEKIECLSYIDIEISTWWRHQMETFSALLVLCAGNSPVTGEFPSQRPVTRSFDIFFDLRLNKRLSKQSWGWWFETPSCTLWHHCNEIHNAGMPNIYRNITIKSDRVSKAVPAQALVNIGFDIAYRHQANTNVYLSSVRPRGITWSLINMYMICVMKYKWQ